MKESENKKRSGILFIISGPSGVGKSTLCEYLLKAVPNLKFSVSTTTRPIRKGEVHGVNYLFTDKENFQKLVDCGEFLEWAVVHNNYYGTQKKMVNDFTGAGYDVVLEVDVQGGLAIQKNDPRSVLIFVVPPKFSELQKRLIGRGTDSENVIQTRLGNAPGEMEYIKDYDYLIINDCLEDSQEIIKSIFIAERNKVSRTLQDYLCDYSVDQL